MKLTRREVAIPHHYEWMTEGSKNRGKLFKRYIAAYVKHNYPGWYLSKITGRKAIIKLKEEAGNESNEDDR
ncbi:hypothetical protein [Halobacillus ihumii]|uniref:hypothetical protein n=1 Tax=Halobacillus ihumii TaxID=2686092 RepID=UPI0013D0D715|nr:hypothetical protein [Halobacillus ihumii]